MIENELSPDLAVKDLMYEGDLHAGRLPDLDVIEKLIMQCVEWDRAHPIGSEVIYHPTVGMPQGIRTRTRTGARLWKGHSAVILIEGNPYWVPLENCEPIEPK